MTLPHTEQPGAAIMLRERAYQEIKHMLLSTGSGAEPFLSTRKLARQLGLGNTPVRSAIERLENEGLILISPQQGIAIRELLPQEITDHYEIRQALEPFVVRRLAGSVTEEQQEQLRHNLSAQDAATRNHRVADIVRLDAEFHLLLCSMLGNQEIHRTMLQQRDKIHRVILRMARVAPERFEASYAEHDAVAAAVFAGEAERAATLMFEHLEHGRQKLLPGAAW